MQDLSRLLEGIPPTVWQVTAAIVAAALILTGLWLAARHVRRHPLEDALTIVSASIATGVSAQGMWRFSGDVLGFDGPLRLLLFAFIEVAIITSAVRARRSMRLKYSAGIDGIAVWVLTCLTAVLSAMDARSPAEAVFRLAAPLVAAWLWERGMAVERHRITGLSGINWRLTPERILVRLGLAEARDRTASEVDAHRHLTRVALAAVRARELTEAGKPGKTTRRQARALARLRAALERAEEHTDLATNPATQGTLLDKALILRSGTGLTQLPDVLPWATLDHPAVTGAARHSEAVRLAEELRCYTRARLGHDPVAGPVAVGDRSPTATATGLATTPQTGAEDDDPTPPSGEGRSWLASLTPWTRPEPRPAADLPGCRAVPLQPIAEPVVNPGADTTVDATDPRPVADRKRPDEQDRKRAIRFYITRAKKLSPPSKRELAEWTTFSETWALGCIQEGRQQMTQQGWTFDDRGTPTPPAETVADVVATTPVSATVNGSAPPS